MIDYNGELWLKAQGRGKSTNQLRRIKKHIRFIVDAVEIIKAAGTNGINVKELSNNVNWIHGAQPTTQEVGNHLAILRRRIPDAVERFFHSINGYNETYYRWVGTEETETVLNRVYGNYGNTGAETDA